MEASNQNQLMTNHGSKYYPPELDPETNLFVGGLVKEREVTAPSPVTLCGRLVRIEPMTSSKHLDSLFELATQEDSPKRHRYLFETPPNSKQEMKDWVDSFSTSTDPLFFVVIELSSGRVQGRFALLRTSVQHMSVEIGYIYFGNSIAGTPASTEVHYLMTKHIFEDLGFRRYEWKCDSLNLPSRRAAERLGFSAEGIFRHSIINKGRSRDTAWFGMLEEEWHGGLKEAFQTWLDLSNFNETGQQKLDLRSLTKEVLSCL